MVARRVDVVLERAPLGPAREALEVAMAGAVHDVEPDEVERDLAQAEAAAPGRHEEREREVREVGDALGERVRRARHGLGDDGRVVVAVRPPVGPVAVEPDVEGVVDGLDAGVVRREERRHGPRVARPDAVRPQPRRQQVDEHEGQRRQDDGPVPVELALELLRGRVLAVDAPRLGEGVPLGERHERVVHEVAEERRLGQGGHEVRAGARRQRQQVRERVDGVLGVEDPALGRGLGRREPGFRHVPDERALQLPERRRALATATHDDQGAVFELCASAETAIDSVCNELA